METINSSGSKLQKTGAIKFILLHHEGCFRDSFHYRISREGETEQLLPDSVRTQHPNSIAVQLMGDLDTQSATDDQITALKTLVFQLKLRYPDVKIGAHRQVRGEKTTTCPGRMFQMQLMRDWIRDRLEQDIQDHLQEIVESQYHP